MSDNLVQFPEARRKAMAEAYRGDGRDWKSEALSAQEELAKLKAREPFKLSKNGVVALGFVVLCAAVMLECAVIQWGGNGAMWWGVRVCIGILGLPGSTITWAIASDMRE